MYGITNAGGGSGTKSTLIISIDSGSTVQVYSNSTYTTLLKTATEKTAGQFWVKGLDNGTYYIKATKGTDTSTLAYTIAEYGVYRISMSYDTRPVFSYTGSYELVDDTDTDISAETTWQGDWKLRLLTSGTLTFSKIDSNIDVFLVGGGGGGLAGSVYYPGSGAGGYTTTASGVLITKNSPYSIIIGDGGDNANGGTSSAFEQSAEGGTRGWSGNDFTNGGGGMGGSGGASEGGTAGTDGGDGSGTGKGRNCYYNESTSKWVVGTSDTYTTYTTNKGQGTTTREFGEPSGTLYASGGANTKDKSSYISGDANTGNGGEGGYNSGNKRGGNGGSGIVIIRNARS